MVLSAHSILTIATKFGLTACCMWWALDLRWDLPQVCRELCEDQQLPGKKRRVSTRNFITIATRAQHQFGSTYLVQRNWPDRNGVVVLFLILGIWESHGRDRRWSR
jgi:hypothetical protein